MTEGDKRARDTPTTARKRKPNRHSLRIQKALTRPWVRRSIFFIFFKKVLDKAGLLCYYNDRKREKGANPMSYSDYWEAHEAEWEAEQEYLRELEGWASPTPSKYNPLTSANCLSSGRAEGGFRLCILHNRAVLCNLHNKALGRPHTGAPGGFCA